MSSRAFGQAHSPSSDETEVHSLYQQLLNGWNQRSAPIMADAFAEEGEMIGFDGSQITGKSEIVLHLQPIFANHPTPAYVASVRDVHLLSQNTPAQFHGRPELVQQMTEDLRQLFL